MNVLTAGLLAAVAVGTMQAAQSKAAIADAKAKIDMAVGSVPRYAPDKFTALPPTARDTLNAAGCRIPQATATGSPHNIITGEFAAKGQRDWAALCSDGTNSQIVMVWGGAARCEDRLSALQDSDVMVETPPATFAFGRRIDVASIEQIARAIERFRQPLGETPSHEAIADRSSKLSAIYYCRAGRWLMIPGV